MKWTDQLSKESISAFILFFFICSLQAQTFTGVIKNADHKPLSGVSIKVSGTDIHAITDSEGKFFLTTATGTIFLEIGKEGFNTELIRLEKKQQKIEVLLLPDLASAMEIKIIKKKCRNHPLLAERN